MESKKHSLVAILLVGFIPSISIIFGIKIIEDDFLSQLFFLSCKLWIFIVPTFWYLRIENNSVSKNFPSKEGIKMGFITGLTMSVIILFTWLIFESTLDTDQMISTLQSKGLSNINLYVLGMLYWIFLNSLLEEYVFRWFVTTKSIIIFGNEIAAIVFSASLFTLHHAIALHLFGFLWWQTIFASFGLLSAAAIWSWLYIRYRSIWVCWLSHAICDVAVFGIGYTILF
ncbi:MAG: CPBP family intramembrane metalloprotease [Candidatus Poseidoniales archaeon]|jgi:membrane protease YdiL (CAAX protease family)|nr:CPBP family intramembrane metalloprotease [Candidatus Poseidoniales archaeon]|tara:strand:- start:595 stop:1278 length:684 start_codon:yes stop_codon:yes gene_type:complete